jgi:hypothetical protein
MLLNEGSRAGDLDYLIGKKLHIDEFESKMGSNRSVVTVSFKTKQREPALDLVRFLENGYDWVLDADVSTGEVDDGEYLVFMEMQRKPDLTKKIMEMLEDLRYLTNIEPTKWQYRWYKQRDYSPVTKESLEETIPNTPNRYAKTTEGFNETQEAIKNEIHPEIAELKKLSGIK